MKYAAYKITNLQTIFDHILSYQRNSNGTFCDKQEVSSQHSHDIGAKPAIGLDIKVEEVAGTDRRYKTLVYCMYTSRENDLNVPCNFYFNL